MNLVRPPGIRLALVGCCLLPGAVAAAVDLRGWLPQLWPLSVLLTVGLFALVRSRAKRRAQDDDRGEDPWWYGWLAIAVFLALPAFAISMDSTARPIALDLWGRPTVVQVVAEDRIVSDRRGGGFDEEFCYRLARLDGTQVPVELCREARAFSPGERITVLLEPTGLVGPETPQQVAAVGAVWRYVLLGLAVLLVAGGWLCGGYLGRGEPATRAPTITRRVSIRSPRQPKRGRRPGAGRKR